MVTAEQIKILRDKTGASINECKKALEEADGDFNRSEKILERKLGGLAGKRSGRATNAGVIESYIHSNGRIGAMVELLSETDFVSRNEVFKRLAHDLAMHIAAASPVYLSWKSIPEDVLSGQKRIFEEEGAVLSKSQDIKAQIVEGKLKAHFDALTLLNQPFVKEQDKTVAEVINEAIGRFGENIIVGRFARFEL